MCVCAFSHVCMYVCTCMYVHVGVCECAISFRSIHSLGQDDVIVKIVTSDGHLGTAAMVVAKPTSLTPGDTRVHVGQYN